MYDIVYVFKNNRSRNLIEKKIQSKDMYYGLTYFENTYKVKVIEFDNTKRNKFFSKLDRFLSKYLSLPLYFSKIISIKNLTILKNSKNIILVNESVACSIMPILFYLKLFHKKNIIFFVMGLYSKEINYRMFKRFHYLYIKLVKLCVTNILFLGKGEFQIAKKFHNSDSKLSYFPFCIDTEFWNEDYLKKPKINKHIIFVGNDSNRDFEKVKLIAKNLPDLNFKIISNNLKFKDFYLKNVEVILGEWGKDFLKDEELREYYFNSQFSIIPLIESSQPSGQSVALQSMSMNVPVLISNTKGFWDPDVFKHNQSIFFVNDNSVNGWVNSIRYCIEHNKEVLELSQFAKILVRKDYNLEIFYNNLSKYLNLSCQKK